MRAHTLCQHGGQDVGLFAIRYRAEHVGCIDIFLAHHVFVGRIAVQYDGPVELFGNSARAIAVAFDQFDLVGFLQGFCETEPDVSAPGDDDSAHRFLELAQFAHDQADVLACGDKKYFVVFVDDGFAVDRDAVVIAVDCRNPGVDIGDVFPECLELLTYQQPFLVGAYRDQANLAIGEVEHLQGAGVMNQLFDVLGNELFGTDDDVDRQRFMSKEFLRGGGVFCGADPRNLDMRVKKRVRHLAGDHVCFVAVGERNDHVCIPGTGALEHVRESGMTLHRANIEAVLEFPEPVGIQVDDGDLVGCFAGEVFGRGRPHLAGA